MFSIMFVSCMFVLKYSFNTVFIYKYLLQHASAEFTADPIEL